MRWIVFAILAYLFFAVQQGLGDFVEVSNVQPEFVFILMVFIAAMAPASQALWSALLLGVLTDLTAPLPLVHAAQGELTIIGPHALGYTLGAALVFQLRTMLYRQHPLSISLMVFMSAIVAHLLAIFLLSLRWLLGDWSGWWTAFQWSPTEEMVSRFLMILYSTILALPLGWVLIRISPIFAFELHPRFLSVR